MDKLINDEDIASAENVVMLMVTATPFNLVTKQSRFVTKRSSVDTMKSPYFRIPLENHYDMYKKIKSDAKSMYFGNLIIIF